MSDAESGDGEAFEFEDEFRQTVDDPDNLTQRERLRELFESRRDVQQYRRELSEARAIGSQPEHVLRTAYRSLLEVYLRELEPLMVEKYPQQGLKEWYDADLGTATFQARQNPIRQELPSHHAYADTVQQPEPVTRQFVGLEAIVGGPEYVSIEFTTRYGPTGDESHAHVEQHQLPFHILDTAYRHSNKFLSDIGLEATEANQNDEMRLKYVEL